ncbi:AIPR family protein [Bacillus paramycoides]|uniref:AIPR family protein n=1 Tax=Bacillus paramycoides TaxID=2026194 RepID=UPI003D016F83
MSIFNMIEKRVEKQIEEMSSNDEKFSKKPKDIKDGVGFMMFSLSKILKNLSYDDIEEGIVDSSYRNELHDYGIDAFYLTANNECVISPDELENFNADTKFTFHIFQFKKGTGIDQGSLLKLKEGIQETFINKNIAEEMNSYMFNLFSNIYELRDSMYEKFDSNQISVKIHICFSGVKENVLENDLLSKQIVEMKGLLRNNAYRNVEVKVIDAQELIDLEREQIQIKDSLSYKKTFKYITETDEKEKLNGYICIVSAYEIAMLVKEWQTQLFEENIRDYFNNKGNNSKIFETCVDEIEGKYFWSFNNGLTITCNKLEELPNDKYRLHGLQIVNGCQTSNTLYQALINLERFEELSQKESLTEKEEQELQSIRDRKLNKEATVLVKIIETDNPDLIYRITETTNSQTPIKVFSLKANEDIHKNIEQFFADYGIYYERRANFYRNQGISTQKIIDIKKLSQLYFSMILNKPSQARANPTKIFVNNYDDIFPSEDVRRNNYKLYLVPVLVYLKLEKNIRQIQRNNSIDNDSYKKTLLANGKFHIACFFLSSILKNKYNEKGIIERFEQIREILNNEEEFQVHFDNAVESLRKAVQNYAGQRKESVPSSLRKADFDNRLIRIFKNSRQTYSK